MNTATPLNSINIYWIIQGEFLHHPVMDSVVAMLREYGSKHQGSEEGEEGGVEVEDSFILV